MATPRPALPEQTLLLAGGGHAHVAVLADWIRRGPPAGVRTLMLTPQRHLTYSGMVPGWLAGQHGADEGLVDLAALAARAGVRWVEGRLVALDPDARAVQTDSGETITFDIASLDTGGVGRARAVLGDDPRILDIRPIEGFVDRIAGLDAPARVVVAGGGAGGVELAFALRNLAAASVRPEVTLVTGAGGLLPGFGVAVRRRVAAELARQGIAVIVGDARIEDGRLVAHITPPHLASSAVERPSAQPVSRLRSTRTAEDELVSLEPADLLVAALGSAPPPWLGPSGLALDGRGFVAVDARQRSISHGHIFAAGDVSARIDRPLAHSGVHAVMAGPVLAANLRAALQGELPRASYHPRRHSLYLINTGDGSAIASYGPLAAQGGWARRWKHAIDRRWIAGYAALAGS